MRRREFLSSLSKSSLGFGVPWISRRGSASAAGPQTGAELALPSSAQLAWQDLELGMFVHFAPNTWQDVESDNLSTPLSAIDPKDLNTDQWAETALALGAKYIVFVAKHQGGFCMWQTETTGYGIRNTPWKNGRGDVLADVAQSCRRFGLKLGVYVCPRDDHFGAATGGICRTPALQAQYDQLYRAQLTEVLSRYGEMVEVWFDGSSATPVGDILRRYQPHAMVFQGPSATIRWVGNEDGFAPYPCWNGIDRADAKTGTATSLHSDPDGGVWMPNEVDVSIRRPDWFWSTANESKVLSQDQLLSIYYRSIGRGAQLLLNIPANRDGLLSTRDCAAAKALGSEIGRRFSVPIAHTAGSGTSVLLRFDRPSRIDTLVLQEVIAKGERIRAYRLEGRSEGAWNTLGTGESVGHKRVQPVGPVTVEAVRVVVTRSAALPAFRSIAVFDTGTPPPSDWSAPTGVWASDLIGGWQNHRFALDLGSKIKAAAQYRLRFIPMSGEVTAISEVVLKLHDVAEPQFIKLVRNRRDELILDLTEITDKISLSGEIAGAATGQILLQKL